MILDTLLGNRTAARALLYIGANRDAYTQEIADKLGITLSVVQAQLRRLETGGVLVSRPRGRMRFYELNPRSPFSEPLDEMIKRALNYMPDEDREKFLARRRPRAAGKPL